MRIRRGHLIDAYVEDGRSIVMVGEQTVVLSEMATVILETVPADTVVALEQIVEAVLDAFGPPAHPHDASSLTTHNIQDLVAHGVLALEETPREGPSTATDVEATRALHTAVAALLTPGTRWTLPSDVSAESFFAAVRRQRVGAQLVTGIDRLQVPGELRARLQAENDAAVTASAGLAQDLHRVLAVLSDAGVRALAFKGLALAAQAWGDENARGYGDLDLLIAPSDLEGAHAALVSQGWLHPAGYPEPGPSWGWRQFVRSNHEMPLSLGRTDLDLHWYALPARNAFPDFDELWTRRSAAVVSGRPVPTLSPYDALAHSASHSAKDHWRWLRGLADVHRLMASVETWEQADRPLRRDQVMTLGIAARIFGTPGRAPEVVHDAATRAERWEATSLRGQLAPEQATSRTRSGYAAVLKSFLPLHRTQPTFREVMRHVARLALPARFLAREESPYPCIALPRITWRRVVALLRPSWRE